VLFRSSTRTHVRDRKCGRVWWLTARVVSDRGSTDGSKARDAPPLHDARYRRRVWTPRRCPSVRAALGLAHLEPSVNPREPTTHDASLQTRPHTCGRVRGQAIEVTLLASCVVRTVERCAKARAARTRCREGATDRRTPFRGLLRGEWHVWSPALREQRCVNASALQHKDVRDEWRAVLTYGATGPGPRRHTNWRFGSSAVLAGPPRVNELLRAGLWSCKTAL